MLASSYSLKKSNIDLKSSNILFLMPEKNIIFHIIKSSDCVSTHIFRFTVDKITQIHYCKPLCK